MSTSQPYGAAFCEALKKLRRLDFVTNKLDYETIQLLKQADRDELVRLLLGKVSYEFLQLIKTQEPAEVARQLVLQEHEAAGAATAGMIFIAGM